MKRHAIIKDNKVVNVVISPLGQFKHPQGYLVIESQDAKVGDIYNPDDGSFSR